MHKQLILNGNLDMEKEKNACFGISKWELAQNSVKFAFFL